MRFVRAIICLVNCILLSNTRISAQLVISPSQYGVLDASNGVQRYACILACHKDAVKKNAELSYAGIKSLEIEIPANAEPIPLPDKVDFAGVQINVLNTQKNMALFTRTSKATATIVTAASIDQGRFYNYNNISNGRYLLIVNDDTPWVEARKGYDYGATRKDVLVVENGVARSRVTSSYNNARSSAKSTIVQIGSPVSYSKLKFCRDAKSTKMTYLFSISNTYDVSLSNISITTPQDNEMYGDAAILIKNSAKVNLRDITINGTYSLAKMYGYGINLDNVAMFSGVRIYARARWGVFGNNNVNGATLRDCDINRFDIHCYGKDVRCYNCNFSDLYNQYSSVYGDVYYENCTFTNFIPVLIEPSYNAYTPFDLTFKTCTFNLTGKKNYFMTLSGLEEAHNSRPELSRKALPNITIKNCTVNLADDVKDWYIIHTGEVAYKDPLDYISKIEVNRLKINGNVDFKVFSTRIKTTERLKAVRKSVKMNRK